MVCDTKHRIGSRYVEVFECLDDDFSQSKRRALSQPNDSRPSSAAASYDTGAVLRLRGLPYGAGVAEVQTFMASWPVQQVKSCALAAAAAAAASAASAASAAAVAEGSLKTFLRMASSWLRITQVCIFITE